MQYGREHCVAEKILGSDVGHRRTEPLGIGSASLPVFWVVVVGLRQSGARAAGYDRKRIHGFSEKELELLFHIQRRNDLA
jgi:hypothetical protein